MRTEFSPIMTLCLINVSLFVQAMTMIVTQPLSFQKYLKSNFKIMALIFSELALTSVLLQHSVPLYVLPFLLQAAEFHVGKIREI